MTNEALIKGSRVEYAPGLNRRIWVDSFLICSGDRGTVVGPYGGNELRFYQVRVDKTERIHGFYRVSLCLLHPLVALAECAE